MTDANGIAVSDGTHRLVIALHDMSSRCRWGGRNVTIDGLTDGSEVLRTRGRLWLQ